ncbi:MAG: hypothetical protein LWY06_10210 [Firmicutes bacterium]|nr:hypothetical protein [Bacillota bacterium]
MTHENIISDFIKESRFEEALSHIENECGNENPAEALALKGEILETTGRLREAGECFREAHRLCPENPEYLYWVCEIYLMMYDSDGAIEACTKGKQLFPADDRFLMVEADAWLWKISVHNLQGTEKEEALAHSRRILNESIAAAPDDGEIRAVEATWYVQKKDFDKCLQSFEAAQQLGLELYVDYIDTGLCLSILNLNAGNREKALHHIEKSLERYLNWNEPHYQRLMLFYEHLLLLREVYFGIKVTTKDLETVSAGYEFYMNRGLRVHRVTRDVRNALSSFIKAREEGRNEDAFKHLEEAESILKVHLPLCIIFNSIKKLSLMDIIEKLKLTVYKGEK